MKNKVEYFYLFLSLLFIFLIYLITLHPVFKNNDSPETSVAAFTLGIGHPPGYPLFTMIAKIFNNLLPGNPAFRTNIFSSFLAILILFFTFILIKKFINAKNILLNIFFLFLLSFSFLFWNQAIEAKGGIYMLNLFFVVILIFLLFVIVENQKKRYIYLISYIYALSLTNHWPSMVILFPIILYIFFLNKEFLNIKDFVFSFIFFIFGVSPYLFLYIRAKTEPVLNWGNPSDLNNFLWVILRKGYVYPIEHSIKVILYQIKEFINLFITNYGIFWIFIIPGIYEIYKNKRKNFYFLVLIFLIIFFAVVIYNRTKEDLLWQMNIFLLPAEYIIFIFIVAGIYYILYIIKIKIFKIFLWIIIIFSLTLNFYKNFFINNNSRNFLLYDYGNNILKTLESDACYIGDGDYNLMPIYYLQEVEKKRRDIKFITVSFLIFKWGIDDFIQRYYIPIKLKPYDTENNIKNIIEYYIDKNEIYISNFFPRYENLNLDYYKIHKGIVERLTKDKKIFSEKIFEIYVYRGIFEKFCILNKMNKDLIGWYPVCMVNQANYLAKEGFYKEAIKLYKKALLFPIEKPEGIIYYNMFLSYKAQNDLYNQILSLIKAVEKTNELVILEEAAQLFYYIGLFENFENIMKKHKINNKNLIEKMKLVKKLSPEEKNEITLLKANEFINTENFHVSKFLYESLLEKNYKKGIIYRNLGVYYFKTGEYEKAVNYFKMSQNETNSPEICSYIAFTQYKMGQKINALQTLQKCMKYFETDNQLKELYKKIKKEVDRN